MELQELLEYKSKFMKDLCCNPEIVRLITDNPDANVPNRALPYSQIYPYEYVPETVDHGQTFICFDVDVLDVINKTFYVPVLYVWVFSHKSKMRLPEGGIRTDELAIEIDKFLNGNRFYGLGTLDLKNVGRFSPILDYQGRVLTYYAQDFNRNGSKPAPKNRRLGV